MQLNDNSRTPDTVSDVVVLGFSLAGIGAALSLREDDHSVVLYELLHDIALSDMFAVDSPFDRIAVSGSAFEPIAMARLGQASIEKPQGQFEVVDWHEEPHGVQLTLKRLGCEALTVRAKSVILAPNGVLPRSAYPEGWEEFIGRGISESASSDGSFFRQKPVCIQGCGRWAIDQAHILAQWASSVTLLCDKPSLSASNPQPALPNIDVRLSARIISMKGAHGSLESIVFNENGRDTSMQCAGLFLCPEPVMEWRVLGRLFSNDGQIRFAKLVSAGLAAGVPFGSQSEQYSSGAEAGIKLSDILTNS
jgi:thioredoxin reductase